MWWKNIPNNNIYCWTLMYWSRDLYLESPSRALEEVKQWREDCTILDWFSAILFDCSAGLKNYWYLPYWFKWDDFEPNCNCGEKYKLYCINPFLFIKQLLMFSISSDILWVSNKLPSLFCLFKISLKMHGWKIWDVCHALSQLNVGPIALLGK